MKVTGFSFIKNAVLFDFPIVAAIQSILPLCDEVIIAVGDCTDGTRELVQNIDATKIKIIDTVWDKNLTTGGIVLANETNKALQAINENSTWCFYIQGDEIFDDTNINEVKKAMANYANDDAVDGLLFNYRHFYGSYDYIATSTRWYKKEIRIIKNNKNIFSYKDAQGFRKNKNQKLQVKPINAYINHYGWVREPSKMMAKVMNGGNFWGGENYVQPTENIMFSGAFDYSEIDLLEKFNGKHPTVIIDRIANKNWAFDYDLSYNKLKFKDKCKKLLQKITGIDDLFEYKNYKLI